VNRVPCGVPGFSFSRILTAASLDLPAWSAAFLMLLAWSWIAYLLAFMKGLDEFFYKKAG
jgi:hypothetical protein